MSEKAKPTINAVGLPWFLRWVFVVTLAAATVEAVRQWALQQGFSPPLMGIITIPGILLTMGAQAYELPFPVRRSQWQWLLYSFGAYMIYSVLYGIVVFPVLSGALFDTVSVRVFAYINVLVNGLINALLVGIAQWVILRQYVTRAFAWIGAMLLVVVVRLPISIAVSVMTGLALSLDTQSTDWVPIGLAAVPALVMSVITGATLWWLIRQSEPKQKRESWQDGF